MDQSQEEDKFFKMLQEIAEHTDASYAMVTASRLEDWLTVAIKSKLRSNMSSNFESRIFRNYGPLSTFSSRIDIGYALGLYETDLHNDLRAIKDIRNEFAHARETIFFKSKKLEPCIQKLTGWKFGADPKEIFNHRVAECTRALQKIHEVALLIRALQSRIGGQSLGLLQAPTVLQMAHDLNETEESGPQQNPPSPE